LASPLSSLRVGRSGFDMGGSMMFHFTRSIIAYPIILIGEVLVKIGMAIAPVQVIASGSLCLTDIGFFTNGFGEGLRLTNDLESAETILTFRMHREIQKYRSAVEEAKEVQAAKQNEAKPSCP
jgi:hypothetical protein